MIPANPFVTACLSGQALPEQADAYVDRWHRRYEGCSLQEYLGVSAPEYAAWISGQLTMSDIVEQRRATLHQGTPA